MLTWRLKESKKGIHTLDQNNCSFNLWELHWEMSSKSLPADLSNMRLPHKASIKNYLQVPDNIPHLEYLTWKWGIRTPSKIKGGKKEWPPSHKNNYFKCNLLTFRLLQSEDRRCRCYLSKVQTTPPVDVTPVLIKLNHYN